MFTKIPPTQPWNVIGYDPETTPDNWNDHSEIITNEVQDPLAESNYFKLETKDGDNSTSDARMPSVGVTDIKENVVEQTIVTPTQTSKAGKPTSTKGTPTTKSPGSNLKTLNPGRSGLAGKRY